MTRPWKGTDGISNTSVRMVSQVETQSHPKSDNRMEIDKDLVWQDRGQRERCRSGQSNHTQSTHTVVAGTRNRKKSLCCQMSYPELVYPEAA